MVERSFTSIQKKTKWKVEARWMDTLPTLAAFSLFVSMVARLQSAFLFFLSRHMQIVFVFRAHISTCEREQRDAP
jgi:hypothetical protein